MASNNLILKHQMVLKRVYGPYTMLGLQYSMAHGPSFRVDLVLQDCLWVAIFEAAWEPLFLMDLRTRWCLLELPPDQLKMLEETAR